MSICEPFRLASRLVTNGEYLEFMRDGGYGKAELWLSDGWDCVRSNQWSAPLYWEQRDGEWWQYTMEGMQPVELSEPVCHVSYYEADAFARWAGARLADRVRVGSRRAMRAEVDGQSAGERRACIRVPAESSDEPLSQMFGDVWEWTAQRVSRAIPDSSRRQAPSASTTASSCAIRWCCAAAPARRRSSHIRATYRNFFPPHVRWQFMGIRLANGN